MNKLTTLNPGESSQKLFTYSPQWAQMASQKFKAFDFVFSNILSNVFCIRLVKLDKLAEFSQKSTKVFFCLPLTAGSLVGCGFEYIQIYRIFFCFWKEMSHLISLSLNSKQEKLNWVYHCKPNLKFVPTVSFSMIKG